jgi:formate hydrogenlyase subunit 6/NADH:ubiquinone oxidoreductase subunit I
MSSSSNVRGFHFPLLTPGCTGCKACNEICPDFVFEVYRFDDALTDDELMGYLQRGSVPIDPEAGR